MAGVLLASRMRPARGVTAPRVGSSDWSCIFLPLLVGDVAGVMNQPSIFRRVAQVCVDAVEVDILVWQDAPTKRAERDLIHILFFFEALSMHGTTALYVDQLFRELSSQRPVDAVVARCDPDKLGLHLVKKRRKEEFALLGGKLGIRHGSLCLDTIAAWIGS